MTNLKLLSVQLPIWLLGLALALALTRPAFAQVGPPTTPAFRMAEPAGPPTDQQLRDQRTAAINAIARSTGMPGLPVAGGGGSAADESATPLPDLTRMVPTTTEPQKLSASVQILLLLSVLTLAPSILLMTTCFTRVVIVLSLLRQALGTAQLPPNQVMIGLALFMTFLIMGPTWSEINSVAIQPYQKTEITQGVAFERTVNVMRGFMIRQIVAAHNEDDVYLFHSYATKGGTPPQQWSEVATTSLVPAFILSELKVSFLMGFRIYLPFLIIDMVIASVLISIGMQLLPPAMISLPFKLLLFVLVDGWHLITATLLSSFN
jgi:flagellar biosynthetic protein FliP